MPRVVMVLTNPTLKVAATQAGLAAGTAYECQVTSAVISTNVPMNTIPSTGCAGASQSPGAPGYQLDIAWLQDWITAAGGGLSGWAWTNKNTKQWVQLIPDAGTPGVKAEGEVWVTPGQFGGTFGDGSAAPASATWAFTNEPDITPATAAMAADTESEPVAV